MLTSHNQLKPVIANCNHYGRLYNLLITHNLSAKQGVAITKINGLALVACTDISIANMFFRSKEYLCIGIILIQLHSICST